MSVLGISRSAAHKQNWLDQCGSKIREIEPRLGALDCEDLAGSLWQIDAYQHMDPHDAAEEFMMENHEVLAVVLTT